MKQIILSDFNKIITLEDWQKQNGYSKNKIAKYIGLTTDNILCEDQLLISSVILEVFDKIREKYGKSLNINSGYRTLLYQKKLSEEGYQTATISPHCRGYALDIGFNPGEGQKLLNIVRNINKQQYNGTIRIGWKQYWDTCQNFIHIDCAPIAYGCLKDESFPSSWKNKYVEW